MLEYQERQKFVDGLKPGDKVASRTRRLGSGPYNRDFGYQIHVVKRISPSRAKIVTLCPDSTEWTFGKEGSCKTGKGWSAEYFYLEPVTAEITESIRVDTIRIKADNRKWRLIKKIEEVRDSFTEKDEFFHLEFLSASDQLMALLDKHTKPDPEDS
jgi:hypothetical protein